MGFEFLTIVPWVSTVLFTVGVSFFVYLIATEPSGKHERTGGHVPPEPIPDRCHLTEQIHAAARDAGLCVGCGETREKCGGFMLEVSVGSPRAPRWVCGVDRPIRSSLLRSQKTEADFAFIKSTVRPLPSGGGYKV